MSDIGSIHSLAGANPALARAAPGARSMPPEPATIQNAVAQPLSTPQSAVTQPPTAGNAEWKRRTDPDSQQNSPQSGASPDRQQLADAVERLNQHLRESNTSLQFEVDDQYQEMVVRIVDQETKEVVRQIPSEKALALAKFFEEMEPGQGQGPPSSGSSNGKDSRQLKMEGWLLRATA